MLRKCAKYWKSMSKWAKIMKRNAKSWEMLNARKCTRKHVEAHGKQPFQFFFARSTKVCCTFWGGGGGGVRKSHSVDSLLLSKMRTRKYQFTIDVQWIKSTSRAGPAIYKFCQNNWKRIQNVNKQKTKLIFKKHYSFSSTLLIIIPQNWIVVVVWRHWL